MKQLKKIILSLIIAMTYIIINISTAKAEEILNCSTTLKTGSNGAQVKLLQNELNKIMSCALTVDGKFGAKTKTCVLSFQNKYSLSQDGVIGSKTCNKLNELYTKQTTTDSQNDTLNTGTDLICSSSNSLKIGDKNNKQQIKYLQTKLNEVLECRLDTTGTFGSNTESCVKKFQKEFNLKEDGIAGPKTCQKLNEIYQKIVANKNNIAFEKQDKEETLNCHNILKQGTSSNNVKLLQTELNNLTSCNLKVDGEFGSKTTTCVKKFQKAQKLSTDGIVGANTCGKLNSSYLANNIYIISKFTSIRESASESAKEVAFAKYGIVFKVYETLGDWYKIKYDNNYHYVKASEVDTTGIIIDKSEQSLKYYENGKLKIDTIVITGNKSTHNTRTGKFYIAYKERGRYLNGTTYVDYWMRFDKGNGLHDANYHYSNKIGADVGWRSESEFYDANRYNGNGSHGCINMLNNDAKALYESAKLKTLVIVKE